MSDNSARKTKILLTRSMLAKDIEYIKSGLDKGICGQYEFIVPSDFSEDEICKEAADADVLLGPFVSEKILACARNVKLIQVPWTGMDTFDFSAMRNCSATVCNTHSNADAVAEIAVTLVLDLIKKVSFHDRKMRAGNWNREQAPLSLASGMLSKQSVCILGCGNIGYRIAKLIAAFGADVVAVDAHRKEDDIVRKVFAPEQLQEAVSKADILICALPLTDVTRGILDSEMIGRMKDGAMVVNVSRAAIIDEDALFSALVSGKIAGFASDVWWNAPKRGETESYPSTHNAFWELENVIMSPYRAGFVENVLPHLDGAIENIIHLCRREGLQDVVNIKAQY